MRVRSGRREAFGLLVCMLLLLPRVSSAVPGTMTAFAGGLGDGAPPTIARLFRPNGVAVDQAGNVYIADTLNHRIRKIDVRGIITTVAGMGIPGYAGDNGDATKARLNGPASVTVDGAGNVLFADTGNNRIRRIVDGVVTTFAGTGPASFSGDKDLAIKARLNRPTGITFDQSGNLFIADTGNNRIRSVSQAGVITTFAGDGVRGFSGDKDLATVARFNAPTAIATAVVASNNGSTPEVAPGITKDSPGILVFIADTGNNRIRRIDTTGKITTFAGAGPAGYRGDLGPATGALLRAPQGMMFDAAGSLLFADAGNNRVRAIDGTGRIRTVAGNGARGLSGDGGSATNARLAAPSALTIFRDTVFVADPLNNRVRAFNIGGFIGTVAGSNSHTTTGDGGHALSARLVLPTVTATGPGGVVYIAETGDHRVRKVASNGTISTVAGTGIKGFSGDGKSARLARLNGPQGLAVDRAGNLYISDTMNQRVRKVDARGIITTIAGTGALGFAGDGKPARYAKLLIPTGLATDTAGNLFIADTANNRIRKVNARGIITTVAGTGAMGYAGEGRNALGAALNRPFGVAVDNDGKIFIADTYNHRIRVVGTTGIITTLAGSKARGYVGDGGPANMAQLNSPFGVAYGGGYVYIVDTGNRRIRVVTPDDVIVTLAGNGTDTRTVDGIPGLTATLVKPLAISLVPNGMLIADVGDNRIRFLERTPVA